MVQRLTTTNEDNDDLTERSDRRPRPGSNGSADDSKREGGRHWIGRRTLLKWGGAAAAGVIGGVPSIATPSAAREVTEGDEYDVWTVTGKETYDLSDGEELSNVLIDQSAEGACLTIRARNASDWTARDLGFLGVGREGDGGNRFQFQVSTAAGSEGVIENIWTSGRARNGRPASRLGGIYVRSSHAGDVAIRHTAIGGFGNNAVYASAVGKDGGNDGTVTIENCYHRDNTASQFRIGSPGSVVRNSVGVINDPHGRRGAYPGSRDNRNARGVWAKHYPDQRFENCSFYVSPDDDQPDGVFEARYISGRSHGEEAVAEIVDCHVNPDHPVTTGSTSNADVHLDGLGEDPSVQVIQDGGVPVTPEMAARGEREMPPELPGADGAT